VQILVTRYRVSCQGVVQRSNMKMVEDNKQAVGWGHKQPGSQFAQVESGGVELL